MEEHTVFRSEEDELGSNGWSAVVSEERKSVCSQDFYLSSQHLRTAMWQKAWDFSDFRALSFAFNGKPTWVVPMERGTRLTLASGYPKKLHAGSVWTILQKWLMWKGAECLGPSRTAQDSARGHELELCWKKQQNPVWSGIRKYISSVEILKNQAKNWLQSWDTTAGSAIQDPCLYVQI